MHTHIDLYMLIRIHTNEYIQGNESGYKESEQSDRHQSTPGRAGQIYMNTYTYRFTYDIY